MTSYLLILAVLLVFSFSFSGFETAITSLTKLELKNLIISPKYKKLQGWLDNPSEYLTAILVGNSIVNICFSMIFTTFIMTYVLKDTGIWLEILCIVLSTAFILVFGEITPKTFAKSNPLLLTLYLLPFISFTKTLLRPVLVVFDGIVRLFFRKNMFSDKNRLTQDDLKYLISAAVEKGLIKYEDEEMINSIFSLKNKKASDIMVKFEDIEMVEYMPDSEKFLDILIEKEKSRIPVFKGDRKNIMGFIYLKDVLQSLSMPAVNFCQRLLRPAIYVSPSDSLYSIFEIFKKRKVHIVLVREANDVVGLITLEDILEEITGDILDEYDIKYSGKTVLVK